MTAIFDGIFGRASAVVLVPDVPGLRSAGPVAVGRMRLPTESIGTFVLSLTNLVVGSAVRIELAGDGSLVEYRLVTNANEVFTIPAYSAGNAGNSLRIKVRKGSAAPFYKPYETLTTAFVGSQSVYVSQISD